MHPLDIKVSGDIKKSLNLSKQCMKLFGESSQCLAGLCTKLRRQWKDGLSRRINAGYLVIRMIFGKAQLGHLFQIEFTADLVPGHRVVRRQLIAERQEQQ